MGTLYHKATDNTDSNYGDWYTAGPLMGGLLHLGYSEEGLDGLRPRPFPSWLYRGGLFTLWTCHI